MLSIRVMLDSGANSNFINHEFAQQYQVPQVKKNQVISLQVIDGTSIMSGGISYHIELCELTFSNYHEPISFNIIPLSNYDVVLGIPWLCHHNPKICWSNNTIELGTDNHLTEAATSSNHDPS